MTSPLDVSSHATSSIPGSPAKGDSRPQNWHIPKTKNFAKKCKMFVICFFQKNKCNYVIPHDVANVTRYCTLVGVGDDHERHEVGAVSSLHLTPRLHLTAAILPEHQEVAGQQRHGSGLHAVCAHRLLEHILILNLKDLIPGTKYYYYICRLRILCLPGLVVVQNRLIVYTISVVHTMFFRHNSIHLWIFFGIPQQLLWSSRGENFVQTIQWRQV